jgi:hypothetical protein
VALTLALQVVLVAAPFLRDVFDLEVLGLGHWLAVIGVAVAYAAVVELEKWASHRSARPSRARGGGAQPGISVP